MKILKLIGIIVILIITHYSCNNEDTGLSPSQRTIVLEGEGGTKTITFETGDWRIAGVINKNGGQRIFGEIFDQEGKLVRENSLLELSELGKLDASWTDKGFNICRKTSNSLQIEVHENATNEEFSFAVIIAKDGLAEEIVVTQKVSEGYSFENIEYFIAKDDGDSFQIKQGTNYTYELLSPMETTISPFNGVNMTNTSYFESNDHYAFVWFKGNLPEVKVPSSIVDGKIYLSNEKKTYGEVSKNSYEKDDSLKDNILVPVGKSKFRVEVEWRSRQVSYRLTMKNNRTENRRTVEGKWFETTPTGRYEIIRDY